MSSKTTTLLSMIDRYKLSKKKCLCIKPNIDDRYSKTKIMTHDKKSLDALNF